MRTPLAGSIALIIDKFRFSAAYQLCLALVLLLAGFVVQVRNGSAGSGMDFWRPWAANNLFQKQWHGDIYSQAGREDMYRLTISSVLQSGAGMSREYGVTRIVSYFDIGGLRYDGVEILQSPFLLSVVRPFASGDYSSDRQAYLLVSIFCFSGATFLLCRLLSASVPVALALTGGALLAFKAEFIQLEVLNVNNFQLGLIALFLWFQRRGRGWSDVTSGVMLGLAIALKPNLIALLPVLGLVWAAERLWAKLGRVAIGVLGGMLIAIATGTLVVPAAKWSSWIEILPGLINYQRHAISGNISLATILSTFLSIDASRPLFIVGAMLITAVAVRPVWTAPRLNQEQQFARTLLAVGAGVLLMLVTTRLVWMHYVVLALPIMLYFARSNINRYGISGGIYALMIFLLPWLGTRSFRDKVGPTVSAIMAWDFALVILFAWALGQLWNSAAATTLKRRATDSVHPEMFDRNRGSAST